jgi:hypothetical protein
LLVLPLLLAETSGFFANGPARIRAAITAEDVEDTDAPHELAAIGADVPPGTLLLVLLLVLVLPLVLRDMDVEATLEMVVGPFSKLLVRIEGGAVGGHGRPRRSIIVVNDGTSCDEHCCCCCSWL